MIADMMDAELFAVAPGRVPTKWELGLNVFLLLKREIAERDRYLGASALGEPPAYGGIPIEVNANATGTSCYLRTGPAPGGTTLERHDGLSG